jgi:hypothetical protein
MNHLIWRLHRNQVYFAGGALVGLAVLLIVTGTTMAHDYRDFLTDCATTQSCAIGQGQLFSGDGFIIDLVNFTIAVPLLFGLFWGAPLLAKEFEDGTHNLAWTQGATRRHWLSTNVMWALLAAAIWGAAMAALVSWWRSPENAMDTRFGTFDIQGIAPVAYSLFAVALGIAVGSVFRRVLPAIATTLGIFVALRVAIGVYLRPHLMKPISALFALKGTGGVPQGSWVLSTVIVGPHGHNYGNQFSPADFPTICRSDVAKGGQLARCFSSHGFRQLTTYQPASRFWAFQGIESVIFIVLAALLVAFAYWRTLTRDA